MVAASDGRPTWTSEVVSISHLPPLLNLFFFPLCLFLSNSLSLSLWQSVYSFPSKDCACRTVHRVFDSCTENERTKERTKFKLPHSKDTRGEQSAANGTVDALAQSGQCCEIAGRKGAVQTGHRLESIERKLKELIITAR